MVDQNNMAAVAEKLGELTGEMRAMNRTMDASLQAIRDELKRIEAASNRQMERLENGINQRLDGMDNRIIELEKEDKTLIEKVSRLSAVGGGIGGALAAGLVELLKRIT